MNVSNLNQQQEGKNIMSDFLDEIQVPDLEQALNGNLTGGKNPRQVSILSYISKPAKPNSRDIDKIKQAFWSECAKAGKPFYYSIMLDKKPAIGPSVAMTMAAIRHWGDCGVDTVLVAENDHDYLFQATFVDRNCNMAFSQPFLMPKAFTIHGGYDESVKKKNRFLGGMSRAKRNAIEDAMPEDMIRIGIQKAMEGAREIIDREIKARNGKANWIKFKLDELAKFEVTRHHVLMKFGVSDIAKLSIDDMIQMREDVENLRTGNYDAEDLYADKSKEAREAAAEAKDKLAAMAAKLVTGDKSESRLRFEDHWRKKKPEERFKWLKESTKDRGIIDNFGKYDPEQQVAAMANLLSWDVERDEAGKEIKKKASEPAAAVKPSASANGKPKFKVSDKPEKVDVEAAMKYVQQNFSGYMTRVKAAMAKYKVGVQTVNNLAAADVGKLYGEIVGFIPEAFRS